MISLSFSLIVSFKVLTLKLCASLFSVRALIILFLSFNCSWALTKVLDKDCILSYSLLVLSTWSIKSIKESLPSFDKKINALNSLKRFCENKKGKEYFDVELLKKYYLQACSLF